MERLFHRPMRDSHRHSHWCSLLWLATLVHFTRLIGSPLVSRRASKSACKLGSCSSCFFLPPPSPRIRFPDEKTFPASISRIPALIVFFETPASLATRIIFPRSLASNARNCLHCFSLSISCIC